MIAPGIELPSEAVPITRTLIVATAIASRDFQDVHHDPELAEQRGSKDIFMNILTSNGLTERYVRNWAGPGAIVRRIGVRLGAPNYPGDTMTFTGIVEKVNGRVVEVTITGKNSIGVHVHGAVVVEMPEDQG